MCKCKHAHSSISDSQKNIIKAIIDDIHETFAREINVYEEGRKILISASAQYNGIYGRSSGGNKTTTTDPIVHTIKARIKYIDASSKYLPNTDGKIDAQMGIEFIDGSVRITVDANGFEILKEAKRCEFEGRKYTIDSKGNATGMFGPQ